MSIELISAVVGFLLTLMIFSYLIGDNPLFRFAIYLFIGVSSGYAATVIVYYVLWPKIVQLQTNDATQLIMGAIPLILGITVLAKLFPRASWIGNFAMAMLVGVGAAAALGGALLGTLIPQAQASVDAFDLQSSASPALKFIEGIVMLGGTVLTLAAFQFGAKRALDGTPKRNIILEWVAWFNHQRLLEPIGYIPPAQAEANYYRQLAENINSEALT